MERNFTGEDHMTDRAKIIVKLIDGIIFMLNGYKELIRMCGNEHEADDVCEKYRQKYSDDLGVAVAKINIISVLSRFISYIQSEEIIPKDLVFQKMLKNR